MDAPEIDPVDSAAKLIADARSKRRRALFIVVVVVAVGVGSAVYWTTRSNAEAKRAVAEAWTDAFGCLLGAPLGENERASLRMRAIQQAAVRQSGMAEDRWPNRCADEIAELNQVLRRHVEEGDGEEGLTYRSEQLALALRKNKTPLHDFSVRVDGFVAAAKKLGLTAGAYGGPKPAKPSTAFNVDTVPENARISEQQYTVDMVFAEPLPGVDLQLMVHDRRLDPSPTVCTFGATSDTAHCRKVPGDDLAGKPLLRLQGTTAAGAAPLVFAGRQGSEGVFRSASGQRVATMLTSSSYADGRGYVALATGALDNDGRFELLQQDASGVAPSRTEITPDLLSSEANQIDSAAILWDTLFVQFAHVPEAGAEPIAEPSVARLAYAKLPLLAGKKKELSQAFRVVGVAGSRSPSIRGCATPKGRIISLGHALLFEADGAFEHPVVLESSPLPTPSPYGTVGSCDSGEVVFTAGTRLQFRCTIKGCQEIKGGPAPTWEPFKVVDSALVDLGGKLLAVAHLEGGGIRFRHATGAQIATAEETILFDDQIRDGAVGEDVTVSGIRLLTRGRFAVLLVSTSKGLFAFRFDADGKPTPVTITWNRS